MTAFLRLKMAQLVWLIHTGIIIFVLIGCALPWETSWLIHIILIPSIFLLWFTSKGSCFLTDWEKNLRGVESLMDDAQEDGEWPFIRSLLSKFMTEVPDDRTLNFYLYTMVCVLWGISCYRFWIV